MSWAFPQAFVLLGLLPLAVWPALRRQGAARLPGLSAAPLLRAGWSRWAVPLLATLRCLALIALIVALAGPRTASPHPGGSTQGIAIQLVLDTSLSMGYTDYTWKDKRISRLDAARHAIRLFVRGDPRRGLPDRSGDWIGLVTFNRYPEVLCPLTSDHNAVLASLDEVVLGPSTNIGDGLAWGLDRLAKAPCQHKVVVLLSDGKHNVPQSLSPITAARLARDLGIRVYTVGAVGNAAANPASAWSTTALVADSAYADSVDEETLQRMASLAGGKYFRATDTQGLLEVCREIARLEKSRLPGSDPVRYRHWYVIPLLIGLFLLTLEAVLGATRFVLVRG
jgi:Ca-activated chloride channel family protein